MSAVQSTPQHAAVAVSTSGNNTIVAAVAGRKVRVLGGVLVAAGAVSVKFQSGTATDITGAMALAANGVLALPFNPQGWFDTAAGALLNLNLGGAVAVGGVITYVEVS